jgi:2'-5' RNA ligase
MKEFTQMIADSHPDLAKRIMAEDDRAAHLGPVKVKPQAKVSSERYSAQQVIDHVKSLHDAATNPITYSWTTKILKQFPAWELRKVSLDQIPEADLNMSVSQPFQAAEYAKLKTPFPAIVLDDRGQIIDGNHRCWAALQRGDDAIWAYTPIAKINESKVGSIEFLPKITAAVLKKATPHEYNIAYVNVPANIAQQIIKEGEATIPDEILGADGREMNSHITVKYGVRDDVEALTEALKNQGPFQVQLGKTHVFPPSEYSHGGVPLVVQVSIPELSALKDIVDAAIGDRVDDFEFAPHITIAYIQPDKAAEYDGLDTFDGVTFTVDAVVLSRKDGSDVRVPLTGGSESKIAAVKSLSIKDLSIC